MNLYFWKKDKPELELTSDSDLEKINKIIFPPLELNERIDNTGKIIVFHTDYCVDSALETVLNDLQDEHNDSKCQETLNSVIKRLLLVRKLLSIETNIHEEAEYIMVENLNLDQNIEDIR